MSKTPLTILVESEAAKVEESASGGEREGLDRLLSLARIRHGSRSGSVAGRRPADTPSLWAAPQPKSGACLDRGERLARLRSACGIWEGRSDLPRRGETSREWEECLRRLGGGA